MAMTRLFDAHVGMAKQLRQFKKKLFSEQDH